MAEVLARYVYERSGGHEYTNHPIIKSDWTVDTITIEVIRKKSKVIIRRHFAPTQIVSTCYDGTKVPYDKTEFKQKFGTFSLDWYIGTLCNIMKYDAFKSSIPVTLKKISCRENPLFLRHKKLYLEKNLGREKDLQYLP